MSAAPGPGPERAGAAGGPARKGFWGAMAPGFTSVTLRVASTPTCGGNGASLDHAIEQLLAVAREAAHELVARSVIQLDRPPTLVVEQQQRRLPSRSATAIRRCGRTATSAPRGRRPVRRELHG